VQQRRVLQLHASQEDQQGLEAQAVWGPASTRQRKEPQPQPSSFPWRPGGLEGGRGGFGRFGRGRGPGRFYDHRRSDDRRFRGATRGPTTGQGQGQGGARGAAAGAWSASARAAWSAGPRVERWNREREERDNPPPPLAPPPRRPFLSGGMNPGGGPNPDGGSRLRAPTGSGAAYQGYGEPEGGRYGAPPAPPYAGGGAAWG